MSETIRLRFEGNFVDGLQFIEAETPDGESIEVGDWDLGQRGGFLELDVCESSINGGEN